MRADRGQWLEELGVSNETGMVCRALRQSSAQALPSVCGTQGTARGPAAARPSLPAGPGCPERKELLRRGNGRSRGLHL